MGFYMDESVFTWITLPFKGHAVALKEQAETDFVSDLAVILLL